MKLKEICDLINGEFISSSNSLNKRIDVVFVSDMMSDVLAFSTPGALLITGNSKIQCIRSAIVAEISGIVFVRGKMPDIETKSIAQSNNIPIIITKLDTFEVCGRIYTEMSKNK